MKRKINQYLTYVLTLALTLSVASCELFDLDINEDPNNPVEASLDLLLANTLLRSSEIFGDDLNEYTHGFVSAITTGDRFDINNTTFNLDWLELYYGPMKDLEELINIAEEQGNNPHYLGIGQLLKAYYFSLMVDLWGDIPYSEALNGDAEEIIKYPSYDDDAAVYQDLISLIDQGIANLNLPTPVTIEGDPIYGGDADQWIKMANSLKLRLLINTRRVQDNTEAITALISLGEAGLILDGSGADDFTFQFSSIVNPENENRHPWYVDAYSGSENGFEYFGNQFMVEMLAFEDPRRPFYMVRQTETVLDQDNTTERQNTPCSQVTGCTYGYLVLNNNIIDRLYNNKGRTFGADDEAFLAGIFGRDRSDPSGIPLDGSLRTALGAYPAGGLFDDGSIVTVGNNLGNGGGIFPMITSEMVKFYMIEAMLTLGVPGNPRELLEEIMNEHITKVANFASNINQYTPADTLDAVYINKPMEEATANYVNLFLTRYDNAPTNEGKLNVVLKQAWFTNFGNGFEMYNAFRRTGYPSDLQEPIQPTVRQFALRLPYAQDDLTFNQNAPESPAPFDQPGGGVFWDVLNYQFQ
ncbi:MAG: SusD/RagB family nutrient-binding outer membrane lipoprotein [Cyclobacteriaceae bacterium]